MASAEPVVINRGDIPATPIGEGGSGGTMWRLVHMSNTGSGVLFGLFRLEPGQAGDFTLPTPSGMREEIYYLLAGELDVQWEDGRMTVEAGQAIFFPTGRRYQIAPAGGDAVDIVWTGFPSPLL